MSETMKQAFGLVRRPWGIFCLKNKIIGGQMSLKTGDKHEAQRILQVHNESENQPHFNLSLARVYLKSLTACGPSSDVVKSWKMSFAV